MAETLPYLLHIDDSPDMLLIVEWLARNRGTFLVDSAGTAAEAVALINQDPPKYSAIVTDYELENNDMTGTAFVTLIRQYKARVPIGVLTSYSRDDVEIEVINAGAQYLSKGMDAEELTNALENLIEGRSVNASRRGGGLPLAPKYLPRANARIEIPSQILARATPAAPRLIERGVNTLRDALTPRGLLTSLRGR